MSQGKAFYVTTPIYYVNDAPHIGNAYTTVAGDMLTRWHRQRGEDVWYLTGTDEHGEKVMRAAQAGGQTAQELTDRPGRAGLEARPHDDRRRQRRLHPDHRAAAQRAGPGVLADLYDAGYVYAAPTRAPTASPARSSRSSPSCSTARTASSSARSTAVPVEMLSEENYFFRLSDFADRLLEHYAAHPDFVQPESARNEVVSFVRPRPARPLHLAVDLRLGHPDPVGRPATSSTSGSTRCSTTLTAAGYRRRRRCPTPVLRQALADRHPPGRQGHPALPRRHLAGHADGRRAPAAAHGVRPRLAARRRREDEQVQADRHPAERDHRRLRLGRLPLLLPAGDPVRPGRVVLLGGHGRALQVRARRPVRQPRVAAHLDGRALSRRRAARRPLDEPALAAAWPRPSPTPTPPSTGSTCRAPSSRPWTSSALVNVYLAEQEPWKVAKDRDRAGRPRPGPLRHGRVAARRRRAAQRGHAQGDRRCSGTRSAPSRRSGPLAAQRVQDAGRWGQLPAGAAVDQERRRSSRGSRSRTRMSRRSDGPPVRRRRGARRPPAPEPLPRRRWPTSHCHLDIADGHPRRVGRGAQPRRRPRRGRRVGVPRTVQIGYDVARLPLVGRGRASHTRSCWRAWRCTPTRRPRLAARGELDAAYWPRSRPSPRTTAGARRSGRPGWTTSAPAEDGRAAQEASFRWHIDLAKRTGKALHDPRPRRP